MKKKKKMRTVTDKFERLSFSKNSFKLIDSALLVCHRNARMVKVQYYN